jgi:hypothetical protein
MAEAGVLLPPNPRVDFLLAHGAAMDRWKTIPYQLGFVTAPLWDHRPGEQQAVIILAFIGSSFLWTYLARPWVEGHIGLFRPRADIFRKGAADSGLSKEAVRRQRWQKAMYYALLLGVFLGVAFLTHAPQRDFPTRGWMEHATGVWIVMTVIDCVNRATDRTNLRTRRIWNIAAAVVLACGFGFGGATVNSYAVLLVLLGVVNIALALLDLGLLLHFAVTPISLREGEAYE